MAMRGRLALVPAAAHAPGGRVAAREVPVAVPAVARVRVAIAPVALVDPAVVAVPVAVAIVALAAPDC